MSLLIIETDKVALSVHPACLRWQISDETRKIWTLAGRSFSSVILGVLVCLYFLFLERSNLVVKEGTLSGLVIYNRCKVPVLSSYKLKLRLIIT
mmetsp:Transcript_36591/g.49508  ORF Transcript_36591/g.49508 Transcript_36591/m.49508 type:complete len:94 (+) Transcript_36591:144-425(+)